MTVPKIIVSAIVNSCHTKNKTILILIITSVGELFNLKKKNLKKYAKKFTVSRLITKTALIRIHQFLYPLVVE